jgi:hypothetical protein
MALAVAFQRALELALPDEAPGSNHVGDDVYPECFLAHVSLKK